MGMEEESSWVVARPLPLLLALALELAVELVELSRLWLGTCAVTTTSPVMWIGWATMSVKPIFARWPVQFCVKKWKYLIFKLTARWHWGNVNKKETTKKKKTKETTNAKRTFGEQPEKPQAGLETTGPVMQGGGTQSPHFLSFSPPSSSLPATATAGSMNFNNRMKKRLVFSRLFSIPLWNKRFPFRGRDPKWNVSITIAHSSRGKESLSWWKRLMKSCFYYASRSSSSSNSLLKVIASMSCAKEIHHRAHTGMGKGGRSSSTLFFCSNSNYTQQTDWSRNHDAMERGYRWPCTRDAYYYFEELRPRESSRTASESVIYNHQSALVSTVTHPARHCTDCSWEKRFLCQNYLAEGRTSRVYFFFLQKGFKAE